MKSTFLNVNQHIIRLTVNKKGTKNKIYRVLTFPFIEGSDIPLWTLQLAIMRPSTFLIVTLMFLAYWDVGTLYRPTLIATKNVFWRSVCSLFVEPSATTLLCLLCVYIEYVSACACVYVCNFNPLRITLSLSLSLLPFIVHSTSAHPFPPPHLAHE